MVKIDRSCFPAALFKDLCTISDRQPPRESFRADVKGPATAMPGGETPSCCWLQMFALGLSALANQSFQILKCQALNGAAMHMMSPLQEKSFHARFKCSPWCIHLPKLKDLYSLLITSNPSLNKVDVESLAEAWSTAARQEEGDKCFCTADGCLWAGRCRPTHTSIVRWLSVSGDYC